MDTSLATKVLATIDLPKNIGIVSMAGQNLYSFPPPDGRDRRDDEIKAYLCILFTMDGGRYPAVFDGGTFPSDPGIHHLDDGNRLNVVYFQPSELEDVSQIRSRIAAAISDVEVFGGN